MNMIALEVALRAASIILERVAGAMAGGQTEIPTDDLFINRTAEQALDEASREQTGKKD